MHVTGLGETHSGPVCVWDQILGQVHWCNRSAEVGAVITGSVRRAWGGRTYELIIALTSDECVFLCKTLQLKYAQCAYLTLFVYGYVWRLKIGSDWNLAVRILRQRSLCNI